MGLFSFLAESRLGILMQGCASASGESRAGAPRASGPDAACPGNSSAESGP